MDYPPSPQFVQINKHFINLAQILAVYDLSIMDSHQVSVYLGGHSSNNSIKLYGEDAVALKAWLAARSSDVKETKP